MRDNPALKSIGIVVMIGAAAVLWLVASSAIYSLKTRVPFSITAFPLYAFFYWGQPQYMPALKLAAGLPSVALLIAAVVFGGKLLKGRKKPPLGETAWAIKCEMKRGKLLDKEQPVYLGKSPYGLIGFGGEENITVFAPPRSGKTSGLAIPAAMTYRGSVFVLDIRKTIWEETSGVRAAHGQLVYLFDPFSREGLTARYNPLAYVPVGTPYAHTDINNIAHMLIPHSDDEKTEFWNEKGRMAFLAIALILSETKGATFTIGEIVRTMMRSDAQKYLRGMIQKRENSRKPYTIGTVSLVLDYINGGDSMYEGVKGTATRSLGSWLNPMIDAATSANDFDLRQVRHRLYAIYVGINPIDMAQIRPLVSLMVQQIVNLNMPRQPKNEPPPKHKLLMILDEFTTLGKVSSFVDALAFINGYGIRALIIAHSKGQLADVHGHDRASHIVNCSGAEVIFGTRDWKLAQELSNLIGQNTEKMVTINSKGGKSISERGVPFVLPQEILRLDDAKLFVLRKGVPPVRGEKIRYWLDDPFSAFYVEPPQIPSIITQRPKIRDDEAEGTGRPPDEDRAPQRLQAEDASPIGREAGDAFVNDLFGHKVDLSKFKDNPAGAGDLLRKVVARAPVAEKKRRQREDAV